MISEINVARAGMEMYFYLENLIFQRGGSLPDEEEDGI